MKLHIHVALASWQPEVLMHLGVGSIGTNLTLVFFCFLNQQVVQMHWQMVFNTCCALHKFIHKAGEEHI